jgi:hypothetical protein
VRPGLLVLQVTRRWCGSHGGEVAEDDAQIVGATETGSGPGRPVYACIDCIRGEGLVPLRPALAKVPGYPDARIAVPLGRCQCCQRPVYPGGERREPVEQGTSATADVLLHREACRPDVRVRRHI